MVCSSQSTSARLQLEQRLVRGQPDVVAALGRRAAQPAALAARQHQHSQLALQQKSRKPLSGSCLTQKPMTPNWRRPWQQMSDATCASVDAHLCNHAVASLHPVAALCLRHALQVAAAVS